MKVIFLNRLIAVFLLFSCFGAFVYADIKLVEPIEQALSDKEVAFLGLVPSGSSFPVIASTDSLSEGIFWDSLSIDESTLPAGFSYVSSVENDQRLSIVVTVPVNAIENIYEFKVQAKKSVPGGSVIIQSFTAKIEVRKNVVSAVFSESTPEKKEFFVGEKKYFRVSFANQSISDQVVLVSSGLERDWFSGASFTVPAKQTIQAELPVAIKVHGKKDFSFFVHSKNNKALLSSFDASILARPTLQGKLSATSFGFPFFSLSVAPAYFFNAIIGSFLQ